MSQTPNKQKGAAVRLLWHFMRGSRRYFVGGALAGVGVTLLDLLRPQIIRVTIDAALGENLAEMPAFALWLLQLMGGREYLRSHLWVAALAVALVALAAAVCKYLVTHWNNQAAEKLTQTMRDELFDHIQRLPFAWHMKHQTGDMIQRCTSDVDNTKQFISEQLVNVFSIVVLLVMSLAFMFSMNVKLATVAVVTFPVIILFSLLFHRRIGHLFMECDENEGVLSTYAQENLTGARVVRAFGREAYERDRFEKQNNKYTDAWMDLCKLLSGFWAVGDTLSGLQVMLMVVIGSYLCVQGQLTSGELVAFISYNAMLVWPVRRLGRMIADLSKTGVALERIDYIMSSPAEQDAPDMTTPPMTGDIRFEHVSFGYDADQPVLQDVSFTIPGGITFGILGGTGSGKSTLVHLLNRLYELPEENGRITIGGVPVDKIKTGWLRSHIGMVLQEPFLFSRTIGQNIGIAVDDLTDQQLQAAAKVACLEDAVADFAQGYDTMVGERGVTLSGGQKQRVAIARMLTQNTPIMVFDDSLSAVDAETDARIRAGLRSSLGNATVVLISHRITTLMHADCIIVLDKGRIAQMGTHSQLIEQPGLYRQICELQLKTAEEVQA
ncbi:MAG: ABC transporter ATP-binding protein [Faecalibacterium sp.]|nr:ABC transporter ATP-binding protein [Faecalibacterium sp.]